MITTGRGRIVPSGIPSYRVAGRCRYVGVMDTPRPGSAGEHALQERYDTFKRAAAFYDKQMLDHLNPLMREYIARQEMAFIATADEHGECDASFRAGPPGFIRVLDERTLLYPEYRGNGVLASLGNIARNPHVGILFVDFFASGVGLHVNGRAQIVEDDAIAPFAGLLARAAGVDVLHEQVADRKKTPERWVVVDIVEAYIHCSKHIPILEHVENGADADSRASGDFFKAKHSPRPWVAPAPPKATAADPVDPEPAPAEPAPAPAEAQAAVQAVEPAEEPQAVEVSPEPSPVDADSAYRAMLADAFEAWDEDAVTDEEPVTEHVGIPDAPPAFTVAFAADSATSRLSGVDCAFPAE